MKLIPAAVALVVCGFSGLAWAQATELRHDSSDQLAKATPHGRSGDVTGVPQPREMGAPGVPSQRAWYGGQVLISDAVTLSVLGTGFGLAHGNAAPDASAALIPIGALGYVLVPATIHAFHGQPTTALKSLCLRVGLPALGVVIGKAQDCPASDGGKCGAGPMLGLAVGIALASLLDAAVLSYDQPSADQVQSAQFGISPFLCADGKRGELRAYGTF